MRQRVRPATANERPRNWQIEERAVRSYRRLPRRFRELCGDIVFRVQPFAEDEVLRELEIPDRYGLLGLFHGVGLTERSVTHPPPMPNIISLYREPILAFAEETGNAVEDVVNHVLVHEIGHHFGLSDDDMEAIDNAE